MDASRVAGLAPPCPAGTSPRLMTISAAALLAIGFFVNAALPYLLLDQQAMARYAPRRWWLLVHVAVGAVALLIGPRAVVARRQSARDVAASVAGPHVRDQRRRWRNRRVLPGGAHQPRVGVRRRYHRTGHRLGRDDDDGRRRDSPRIGRAASGLDDSQLCRDICLRHLSCAVEHPRPPRTLARSEQLGVASWFCWARAFARH